MIVVDVIFSLNVTATVEFSAIVVALSAGDVDETVGGVVSERLMKFHV